LVDDNTDIRKNKFLEAYIYSLLQLVGLTELKGDEKLLAIVLLCLVKITRECVSGQYMMSPLRNSTTETHKIQQKPIFHFFPPNPSWQIIQTHFTLRKIDVFRYLGTCQEKPISENLTKPPYLVTNIPSQSSKFIHLHV
jgi:hypothetical protein